MAAKNTLTELWQCHTVQLTAQQSLGLLRQKISRLSHQPTVSWLSRLRLSSAAKSSVTVLRMLPLHGNCAEKQNMEGQMTMQQRH